MTTVNAARPMRLVTWALAHQGPAPLPAATRYVRPTPASVPLVGPVTEPAGRGRVVVDPGARVESNAGQAAGAGFEGRVASQTVAALRRAGGVSAAYVSRANGNREVAVLAAPGFDPARPYQVLVYNRGIEGDNAGSLDHAFIAEAMREVNAAGRNLLLVLPKSPTTMSTWYAGAEDLGALVPEALARFGALTGIVVGEPRERWLMAHSGAGKGVENAMRKPGSPRFDRIMLADSTYGTWAAGTLAALRAQHRGVKIAAVVTEHNAERAKAQLGAQGIRVDAMPAYRHPGHNGVPSFMLERFVGANPTMGFSTVR